MVSDHAACGTDASLERLTAATAAFTSSSVTTCTVAAAAEAEVRSSARAWRVAATRAARGEEAGALAAFGAARAAFAAAFARAMWTLGCSPGLVAC